MSRKQAVEKLCFDAGCEPVFPFITPARLPNVVEHFGDQGFDCVQLN
jgi:hypothetical protein